MVKNGLHKNAFQNCALKKYLNISPSKIVFQNYSLKKCISKAHVKLLPLKMYFKIVINSVLGIKIKILLA